MTALPEHSLLHAYHANGDYTDCFTVDVAGDIAQQQFVAAFYTSRLFKVERFILKWLVAKPSTDREADLLASGSIDSFAAWTVEGRRSDQLLLCDYQGRTRSWLMVEPVAAGAGATTRLFFGTGVVSATDRRTGRKAIPLPFRLLLGFHRRYARALLRSAVMKLAAHQPTLPPAPSKLLWAAELPRAAWTVASWPRHRRELAAAPRGNGRPIMLLPGLLNSDRSNFVLRRFLQRLGYDAHGWGLGRNLGARTVGADAERLIARIEGLAAASGPVTLIGISLGGIIARLVAHRRPDLVREVITVSSPFAGPGTATNVWRVFQWTTGERLDDPAVLARNALIAQPLPVPTTAIWSRSDGLVAGTICWDTNGRSIEIQSSHLGVQIRPDVLLAISGVLANEEHYTQSLADGPLSHTATI